ncbi:hypothetical protein L2E82_30853 [Cichorium intybus]|uniref:Uncharacterized protein n=1 Tax=Cichorium intybus TaxID=13427 RepID=A0ACB9D1F8_CICIN|nr:hypothetical protein L2E82_30853 [Cichorium intybus]
METDAATKATVRKGTIVVGKGRIGLRLQPHRYCPKPVGMGEFIMPGRKKGREKETVMYSFVNTYGVDGGV